MDKKESCSLCDKLFEDIDKERIRRSVELLREEHPAFTRQELCSLVIEREATFCGIVGGFTGALPWPWLILGVAPDLIALLVKQSQMILSIAYIYGCDPDCKERILEILGCLGTSVGAVAGTYGIRRIVERSAAKAVTDLLLKRILRSMVTRIGPRFVPIIGAAAGVALNQASVRSVGKIALEFYKYYKIPAHMSPAAADSGAGDQDEGCVQERKEHERLPDEDEEGQRGSLDNILSDEEMRDLLDDRVTDSVESRKRAAGDDVHKESPVTGVGENEEKESAETDSDDKEEDPQNAKSENMKKKITRIPLNNDEELKKPENETENSEENM